MNILHLTDIHFGRNYPEYGLPGPFSEHETIIDGIIHTIEQMEDSLKPEHIIFTGDIVWHGKQKEYHEALAWFKRLLAACNLTGKDISFCVGNHDIDLSCHFDDIDYDPYMIKEIDDLYRYENITKMEKCLYGYNEFCRELGVVPYTYPLQGKRKYSYSIGYKDVAFPEGKVIRILAMNTALLMTQKKIPDDKMWLGREQIQTLMRYGILPADSSIWYTIGLFHHADRFLHPNETSSYDGRNATLPVLQECTDLLVCGHTESDGRPRLSRQPGGGTLLFGGAAYYNDEHINSFSMLYISDRKKRMGYIPYIFEGEWKDCEFFNPEDSLEKGKVLEKAGQIYENVKLVLENDMEQFTIPFAFVEFKDDGNKICSDMDLMNDFTLQYDQKVSDEVSISGSERKKNSFSALAVYEKFIRFIRNSVGSVIKCRLVDEQGQVLKTFGDVAYEGILQLDHEFIEDILYIEKVFDVRFTVPDKISKKEYEKIDILKTLGRNGYTDRVKVMNHFCLEESLENMKRLYEKAREENKFGVYGEETFSIRLFDVDVMVGKVVLGAGPFHIDLEELRQKIDTYAEGDIRYCYFHAEEKRNAFIVKDMDLVEKQIRTPAYTLIDNYGDLKFSLDL